MDVSQSKTSAQFNQDEERYESYRLSRRAQQDAELKDMDNKHQKEMDEMAEFYKKQAEDADKAYKVDLSRQDDDHKQKLDESQKQFSVAMKKEKEDHEKDFDKVRERERQRVDAYRKNQDTVIEEMHDKYVAAQEDYKKKNS